MQPALYTAMPTFFVEYHACYFASGCALTDRTCRLQGISQTLIIARVGLSRFARSDDFTETMIAITSGNERHGASE
jgi:hypothetical protein